MIHAILVLARARFLIARNTIWRGNLARKIGLVVLVLLGLLFAYGLYSLMHALARTITDPEFIELLRAQARRQPQAGLPTDFTPFLEALPSTVLFGAMLFLMFTGFSTVLSSLYLSGDLDTLMVAPVPMRAVFIVKFFGGLVVPYLLMFLLVGPALVGFGIGLGYGWPFFLATVAALLLLPLLPTALGALLVMAVVRVIPARRAREIVSVLGGLLGLVWFVVVQFSEDIAPQVAQVDTLDALRRANLPVLPSAWAGRALLAAGQGEWLTLLAYGGLFTLVSLGTFALCVLLAERLYYAGWANMAAQGGRVRRPTRAARLGATGPLARLARLLPEQSRAILYKDLRVFPRDIRHIQQFIFPLVVALIWTINLLRDGTGGADDQMLHTLRQQVSTGIAFYICMSLSNALAGSGISREGRGYWMLKVAPISSTRLLIGKLALAYLPFPLVGIPFVLLLGAIQRTGTAQLAVALLLLLAGGLGTTAISVGMGAIFPRLDWENPQQQYTWQAGCLAPLFYLSYAAVALLLVLGVPALGPLLPAGLAGPATALAWLLMLALTGGVLWATLAAGAASLDRLEV